VDFGVENPNAYRVAFMIEKSQHGEFLEKHRRAADDRRARGLPDVLRHRRRVSAAGLTVLDDVLLTTQTLWAGLHGLVSLLIARAGISVGRARDA
jgi:hypothetical protein